MPEIAEKARTLRLQRLQSMLDKHLEHPPAAMETLIAELGVGESLPHLWEALHAAAVRDGKEVDVAAAYRKLAAERRRKELPPEAHAEVLMHAADFFLGVLGDRDGAEEFLQRVLEAVPNHLEAFTRLERRFEAAGDKLRLAQLYATVATEPPKAPDQMARSALNVIARLPAKLPLPDDACQRLLALVPASLPLLDSLDAHCRKTGRPGLAGMLREQAIANGGLSEAGVVEQRRRLVELFIGDAATPELAIPHVEELLRRIPADAQARAAAERLLSVRSVASRAAAALQEARRQSRSPG